MSHAEKIEALAKFLDCESDEICHEYGNVFSKDSEEYEVLTDSEADSRWEEELQYYIDEVILPELPDFAARYFDCESWKRDARFDGRGHAISRYDGYENESDVDGEAFYIYRQN